MGLKEKFDNNPVISVLALLLSGFVAGIATYGVLLQITNQETVRKGEIERQVEATVQAELASWTFTKSLYASLPSDIDFLARDLTIDLRNGAVLQLRGPLPDQWFQLTISQISKTGDGVWSAHIVVDALVTGGNGIRGIRDTITIAKGVVAGPINAGTHSFYVFVEEISVGGQAIVAIGRRESAVGARGPWHRSIFIGGPILTGPAIPVPDTIIIE